MKTKNSLPHLKTALPCLLALSAVIARGVTAGPDVARILKAVEAAWVAEDFPDAGRVGELVDETIGRKAPP